MKTLKQLCTPQKVEQDTDVLDIIDLAEDRIDPALFFETNYKTHGMAVLLKTAFERFKKKSQQKLIKLTQSMGGGKTHNMISLGLVAKHPEYRKEIIGNNYHDDGLGEVKVLAFSGRESNTPNGMWGLMAKQLGKESEFKLLWEGGLRAPGESEWINMLKGSPKLILLDELPPYLENAKTIAVGSGDLAVVTTTALANLFNALNRPELDNILVVISDLKATYQSGTRLLQSTFPNLEGEVNRFAMSLQPVGSSSDEIYDILRAKLFARLPDKEEISDIAKAYREKVEEANNLGFTNYNRDKVFTGIKESYPFHPSIRELYERFKENQNFQQTRDLIRLMRKVITSLWETGLCDKRYLINAFDIDLNESSMNTTITQIKPSLGNAISKDIANEGRATAEVIDVQYKIEFISQVAKLLLVASLADVPNALLGLTKHELVGYLVEPGKDITNYRNAIEEFLGQAWYVHSDKDGRMHFQNVRNLIAELNSLVDGYDDESARLEIRKYLTDKFKTVVADCYQNISVFPAVDEIRLEEEKILLVLFEPNITGGGLNPDLLELYEDTQYKNRVMFLTGERNTMDNLSRRAKEYKAIQRIIAQMRSERVPENNPQFEMAVEREIKINLAFLQAARETFVKLYYPFQYRGVNRMVDADFMMEWKGNNYNGEEQVRKILTERQKFTSDDPKSDSFREKCLERLFTLDEMRREDLRNRAATNPAWQWHHPKALEELIDHCLRTGTWFQAGNYIQKDAPKEETSVTVQPTWPDKNKSEAILKILPRFGDVVYYEYDQPPTKASDRITDFNSWKTDAMVVYFLCIDSKGTHETGQSYKWANRLSLRYKVYDAGDEKKVKLEASAVDARIVYTTDGSDPKDSGATYADDFVIPKDTRFVLAFAEKKGVRSEKLEIRIDWARPEGLKIDKHKPLTYEKINELIKNNEIYFGEDGTNRPKLKRFLQDVKKGITYTTLWDFVPFNTQGSKEMTELLGNLAIFDNPKPCGLIYELSRLGLNKNDIALDFFSGSCTTAHAVLGLNKEDDGNRKFIMVQLPEPCDEKSEAFKAGYKTIAEIGKERIRRAGDKILEENKEKEYIKNLDIGFKVFKLDSSNIKSWDADFDNLEQSLFDAVYNIKEERTEDDVLYEILLKYGLDLTLPIEERKIAGKTVYSIGMGALVICLDSEITIDVVEGIGRLKDELNPEVMRVVFKDSGFKDDVIKTNAIQILKQYNIEDVKSL